MSPGGLQRVFREHGSGAREPRDDTDASGMRRSHHPVVPPHLSRAAADVRIECGGAGRTVSVRCDVPSRGLGTRRAAKRYMRATVDRVGAWTPSLGAVPRDGGISFSVWAPEARHVEIVLERDTTTECCPLLPRPDGMFEGWHHDVPSGTRYRVKLDGGEALPDPASRHQPEGPFGPSAYIDPTLFEWTDGGWRGVSRDELVIYELHVGTFTPEGTFAGVESRLPYLASLGVTAIELMPLAECAGTRNWGYDGVDLFAPYHHYGAPDDLRHLIDAAHRHGLAVLIDVVYNHFGPDGAFLLTYSKSYLSTGEQGPWGAIVNLDGDHCKQVRAFLIENALHWIHEYHADGLRVDATHTLVDRGHPHFLAELCAEVKASTDRPVIMLAEDERNLATLLHAPPRGFGFDAVWADDWHHQMRVALSGEQEGYFADFQGTAADIAETIRGGWFYAGQRTITTRQPRGTDPSGLTPSQFVFCLQNHDQIGNRALGDRLHHTIAPSAWRAASVALLIMPQVPMLFMGQEWAASTPFLYFTDHKPDLGAAITEGRRGEFAAFAAFADPIARAAIPDPQDPESFARSRLVWDERAAPMQAGVERLYRATLQLRMREPSLRDPRAPLDAYVLDDDTVTIERGEWMVILRLRGAGSIPAPASVYELVLTSDDRDFCLDGTPPTIDEETDQIHFNGPAAIVMRRKI
jgi:maltooligosyltrehalose trehalohydrolase